VAQLLESAGADRVMAVDLHCGQIQGFFRIPVDNLYGRGILVEALKEITDLKNVCICSPDAGGTKRAEEFQHELKSQRNIDASLAMMNKTRQEANKVAKMELVGTVEGCDVIIVDDMIDTAGTLTKCADVLKQNGANRVFAVATHGIFSGNAMKVISNSVLEKVYVTDTIPLDTDEKKNNKKIVQVSCSRMLAECIYKVHNEQSVSTLFEFKGEKE
jgi:ribose-phosphate pyrophosphokinase